MSNKIDHEQIERYLDQEMSPEEQQQFEAELASNKELEAAVTLRKQVAGTIWLTGRKQEKEMLSALGDDLLKLGRPETLPDIEEGLTEEPSAPVVKPLWRKMVIPVSIAAAIIFLFLMIPRWFPSEPPGSQELFAVNYDAQALALSFNSGLKRGDSGSNDSIDSLIQEVDLAFSKDQFSEAISILENLRSQLPNNVAVSYYLAVAFLKNEQAEQASALFDLLSEDPNYGHWAKWFGAMAHLASDQTDKARPHLEALAQQGGYKSKESKAILDQLK